MNEAEAKAIREKLDKRIANLPGEDVPDDEIDKDEYSIHPAGQQMIYTPLPFAEDTNIEYHRRRETCSECGGVRTMLKGEQLVRAIEEKVVITQRALVFRLGRRTILPRGCRIGCDDCYRWVTHKDKQKQLPYIYHNILDDERLDYWWESITEYGQPTDDWVEVAED